MKYLVLADEDRVIDGKIFREVISKKALLHEAYATSVLNAVKGCNVYKKVEVNIKEIYENNI